MTAATVEKAVKARPILMSGPMVRAILEGRKFMTRRVVKPMPFIDYPTGFRLQEQYELKHHPKCSFVQARMLCDCQAIYEPWKAERIAACPYGKPGDRLWVRETWQALTRAHGFEWENLYGDMTSEVIERDWLMYYRATDSSVLPDYSHWRPSIFMPRWASRITLEITDVRVERLQTISEEDAIAEGVYTNAQAIEKLHLPPGTKLTGSCVDKFRIVWESINGKKYPWDSNPFVWVVSFRRVV